MSKKSILIISIIFYSRGIVSQICPETVNNILTSYEQFRESLDRISNVTRVRTTTELRAKGNEFAILDFIGLVQQYEGYEAEEHDVQTKDGYILKLHRISSSPLSPKASNKPVVFLQHGFLASSEIFVNLGPSHDLAFMLADAGYDIWLGNVRGNVYSKRHVKYSPASTSCDFWSFNIDDIGLKDAPALIDAALRKANKTKLIYIGHSMGGVMNFMLLSSKSEYNDKIRLSINLAPAVYLVKPVSLFFQLLRSLEPLIPLVRDIQLYEFLPPPLTKFIVVFAKTVCTNSIGKYLCGLLINPLVSVQNVNFNNISSIFSVIFTAVSVDTIAQLAQFVNTEEFRKFDFGPRLNRKKYNSKQPPEYDWSKITAPQAIFYADRDTFVNPKAAKKDKSKLPNVVSFVKVPESYKHYDFLWAKNARTEYYYKVLSLVKQFS